MMGVQRTEFYDTAQRIVQRSIVRAEQDERGREKERRRADGALTIAG